MMKPLNILVLGMLAAAFLFPLFYTSAQETPYNLLAPLPLSGGTTPDEATTASEYLPGLVRLAIGMAGVFAVVMIIIGGIQYMSTDAFQGKEDAKKTISNALWGLMLVLSAWIILHTINPNLIKFDLTINNLELGSELNTDLGTSTPTGLPIENLANIGCPGCVSLASFNIPHKTQAQNGCASDLCYADKDLVDKLVRLDAELQENDIGWWVTEAFPATAIHRDPCHNKNTPKSGTCVDANFRATSNSPSNVEAFIKAAASVGLTAVYEVESPSEVTNILNNSDLETGNVISPRVNRCTSAQTPELVTISGNKRYRPCCPSANYDDAGDRSCSWITGPHFSVYNQ